MLVARLRALIAPYDPREQDLGALEAAAAQGRPREHWFGVDQHGRDEFSRIVYGARYSLLIGVVSVTVGLSIGLVLGAIAGYFGGAIDSVIMRLMDIMLSIPGLLLAIGIVAVLGPGLADHGRGRRRRRSRSSRGCCAARCSRQRENDFVLAARSVGVPRRTILALAHPAERDLAGDRAGDARAGDRDHRRRRARLSRLGPQDPSTPEWGTMLTDTTRYLQTRRTWR